jgi:hypothetical protein
MKVKEILSLDYSNAESKDIMQKKLRGIKPFREIPSNVEIPLEKLEKYVGLVQRKYALQVDYICPVYIPNENNLYSITVRNTASNEYLTYLYSKTIYEAFVKISILYYALTKDGKDFPLANWEEQKIIRAKKIKGMEDDN